MLKMRRNYGDMIAKSLHQAGYEVDTCNDGEEALDYDLCGNV